MGGGYPGGADMFFDFSWDAPEDGARRSGGSVKRAYQSVVTGAEEGQFSWSSDELRAGRAPSMSQEARASEADAEGMLEAEDELSAAAADASSMAPVAMETNMLRSMISEGDMDYRETNALDSTADVRQADEEAEEAGEYFAEGGEYGEIGEYGEVFQDGEAADVVPVVAAMAEEARPVEEGESPTSSGTDTKGSPTPVDEGVEVDKETGIIMMAAPPAPEPPPPPPPPPPVMEAASSPPIAELIDEKRLLADKEAEQTDKEMRDLELTTVELYPESRLVMLLALLLLIWILFLIITAAVRHDFRTTTTEGTASSDRTAETPPTATGESGSPICPTSGTVGTSVTPNGSATTTTTENPLIGIFICSTEYCKREGDYLNDLISQSSKKPCEDFYEHVCEGWKKSASGLRDNQPGAAVSTDTLLQKAMEDQLLYYIMNSTQADVMPARALYERCINRAEADAALLEAKELFRRWGSEWPRTGTGGTSTDVWLFAAKLLRFLGVPSLVGVEIGLEPRNLDETIIEVGPPKAIFFSKDVSEARVVALFTDAAQSAAQALNPQDANVPKSTANDVSTALTALAPLHLDDLGTSPLDFEVDSLSSLGKGVQVFLGAVFENIAVLDASKRIMMHRGRLARRDLDATVDKVEARAMLNYLGLLAIVALSPFLPESLASLRVLHSVHSIGRAQTPTNEQLCMRAASQAFPASVAKASEIVHKDVRRSVWLSQLETLFLDFVNNVTWMDNLTSLLVKYKLRHHRMARFFPAWPLEDCKPAEVSGKAKGLGAFLDAVSYRQLQELQQYGRKPFKPSTGSPLAVWARYRLCLQLLQIPVGLVNGSVPTNGTVFALHLSRFAVRLYAGLAQLLYEGTLYELEIPLYFTEDAERTLDQLIDCLLSDARSLFPSGLEADRVRNALLEQVLALQLGFMAFRQLLGLRRIWRHDFQLLTLPNVTSDQLFFIYYALDHCELSDAVYVSHQFEAQRLLPAAVRVNAALRQSERFAHTFSCEPGSKMAARERCRLFR
ncbi:hypothetical protein V5799_003411 [Amblyomma americanum]|uniref:M13 family peptidase n=1 Tax=Amblyomma americanum TaxID=6943 RepID=A0AAQ4D917_AMBAM